MKSENVININFEKIAFLQRETFISAINHDLKIPVIAQIRALELLIEEKMGKLNNGQKEIVGLTLDSCRSMYEMLSEILSAYKYENKKMVLDLEHINFVKLIEKQFNKSNPNIIDKNLKIIIKNESYYPIIKADKFQLAHAFEYIVDYCISNAVKNSELLCRIFDIEDYICISLSFESPYFSQEKLETIFNNLSQHRMDKVGCNLGIYLAKQIITAHKGTITSNNYGKDNKFTIKIPLINVNNLR